MYLNIWGTDTFYLLALHISLERGEGQSWRLPNSELFLWNGPVVFEVKLPVF